MTVKITTCLILLTVCALLTTGCDGDAPAIDATLDELWPNEDGRTWIYDLRITESNTSLGVLGSPEDPLPSVQQMRLFMTRFEHDEETTLEDKILRTAFEGDITTFSGVTGQYLTSEFLTEDKTVIATGRADQRFLSLLRQARPDLRDRLPMPDKSVGVIAPYGITGSCWEKTDEHIVGYGDLNTDISWLFLKTPLAGGAVFKLQLVPDLADNIWLYGMVGRQMRWTNGDVSYDRAVEVFTLIDFGVQSVATAFGESGTLFHSFMCYRTIFAPGIGPVYTHEWRSLTSDEVLQDQGPALIELEAVLTEAILPED